MERIFFFDGVCVMCNGLVDWVLKHDKKGIFKLAPLQGETAERLIPAYTKAPLNTVVLLDEFGIHTESDAILKLFFELGTYSFLAKLLRLIPKSIRDGAYRLVAKNRYRLFGQREFCRMPSEKDRARLLP
jgi:predicted DCC family thiol-disulfide oxidoreductase YuxK